jgi:nitroreductase
VQATIEFRAPSAQCPPEISLAYDVSMITLDDFEVLAKSRRATRHFKPDAIAADLLDRVLAIAQWAPSGYNLQPTHFVVVTDPVIKSKLFAPCLKQRQINAAPAVVVITGDRQVAANHFEDVIAADRAGGAIDDAYEKLLRKVIPLVFGQGPLGMGWLAKAVAGPVRALVMPTPSIPAVHKRYWLTKQTMLCAMTLMLAASAAGLATLPMEGFDERRVRKALGIPRSQIVPVVIAMGYTGTTNLKKTRLPIERILHRDKW